MIKDKRRLYRMGGSYILTLPKKVIGKEWHKHLTWTERFVYIQELDEEGSFLISRHETPNSFRVVVRDLGLYGILLTANVISYAKRKFLTRLDRKRILLESNGVDTIKATFVEDKKLNIYYAP